MFIDDIIIPSTSTFMFPVFGKYSGRWIWSRSFLSVRIVKYVTGKL